jgi:hypothetical protein
MLKNKAWKKNQFKKIAKVKKKIKRIKIKSNIKNQRRIKLQKKKSILKIISNKINSNQKSENQF